LLKFKTFFFKDNHCHLEETEKTLKKHQKYSELIILYNTRGLHRKALSLMHDHLGKEDSPLGSYKKITDYLQNLSPEQVSFTRLGIVWLFNF